MQEQRSSKGWVEITRPPQSSRPLDASARRGSWSHHKRYTYSDFCGFRTFDADVVLQIGQVFIGVNELSALMREGVHNYLVLQLVVSLADFTAERLLNLLSAFMPSPGSIEVPVRADGTVTGVAYVRFRRAVDICCAMEFLCYQNVDTTRMVRSYLNLNLDLNLA